MGMLLGYPCKGKPQGSYITMNACVKFNHKYQEYFRTSTTEIILFSFLIPDNLYSIKLQDYELIKSAINIKTASYNNFFKLLDIGEFSFIPQK